MQLKISLSSYVFDVIIYFASTVNNSKNDYGGTAWSIYGVKK